MRNDLKLGFGCSGAWGMSWFSERKAIYLIHQAIDLGIQEFDTAGFYCDGEAERRLGAALKQLPCSAREIVRVTSKTGTLKNANGKLVKDFSDANMRQDVETSLRRLGVEALDALYLHGPDHRSFASSLPILQKLREEGLIKSVGICGEGSILEEATKQSTIDAIMGVYNIFSREHHDTFVAAKKTGQRVVAIAPLVQGLYRRGFLMPTSLAGLWYLVRATVKNRSELRRAKSARWLHAEPDWSASELALTFTLSQAPIDIALTTTTNPAHLAANVVASRRDMPAELADRLTTFAASS